MNRHGFTLIEIAVVLVLVGLVTTAGLILFPKLWHEKQRIETHKYLLAAKDALLSYAAEYNALPAPNAGPILPTVQLKLKEKDSFDSSLRYIVNTINPDLQDKTKSCQAMKSFFSGTPVAGMPLLWQQGMPEEQNVQGIPVAALLVSRAGNDEFDEIFFWVDPDFVTIGNNNQTAAPWTSNFVQAPESESFDDQVVYVTMQELSMVLPECQ